MFGDFEFLCSVVLNKFLSKKQFAVSEYAQSICGQNKKKNVLKNKAFCKNV
jgi:hypothetical protein